MGRVTVNSVDEVWGEEGEGVCVWSTCVWRQSRRRERQKVCRTEKT